MSGLAPQRARLSRSHRLVRRSEFDAVMKSGTRSRDECFNVYALSGVLSHPRLGVTVSRRVSAQAVARNRIKRQIRESFRQHQELLGGLNVVVAAQSISGSKSNAQLRLSLDKHWQRLAQLCKKSPSLS